MLNIAVLGKFHLPPAMSKNNRGTLPASTTHTGSYLIKSVAQHVHRVCRLSFDVFLCTAFTRSVKKCQARHVIKDAINVADLQAVLLQLSTPTVLADFQVQVLLCRALMTTAQNVKQNDVC